jgi:hypothetical protein
MATASRPGSGRALWAIVAVLIGVCGLGAGPASGRVARNFYGTVPYGPLGKHDFALMGKARVGTIRLQLLWPVIQAARHGSFDWSGIDGTVAGAAAQHISVLPTLFGSPAFEAGRHCGRICSVQIHLKSKAQRRDWKRFVSAAARRYGPHGRFWRERPGLPKKPITRWQIWNEQNNPNQRNSPKVYAKLLKLSDQAVSAIDPKARIISGGMFGNPPGGSRKATAWGYLGALYKHGAGKHLHGVALHPYSPNLSGLKFQIKKVRHVVRSHHHGRTQIVITEIGWGSSKKRHPGTGSRGAVFNVGPKKQKRKLVQSFRLLTSHRKRWRIGGIDWFTWKDPLNPPPGLCAFCYSSGLYKANSRPKPALKAYKRFTKRTR